MLNNIRELVDSLCRNDTDAPIAYILHCFKSLASKALLESR